MKDTFSSLFNNVFHFGNLFKNSKSNYSEIFQVIGFFTKEEIEELEKIITFKINKIEIFEQALTHRSYTHIKEKVKTNSNERLEFLGDSILGMIVAEFLFFENRSVPEGDLTKMRSWLVKKSSLALCAKQLNLEKYLRISFGAKKSISAGSDSILADALEALIAAIYLDSGLEKARKFILEVLFPILTEQKVLDNLNYKSLLLEKIQAEGKVAPKYFITSEIGPDHDKEFTVEVKVGEETLGSGSGKSKQKAEQDAAKNAMEN